MTEDRADDPGHILDVEDGIATVTLDRPASRNAINDGMRQGLLSTFDRLASDPGVRAVVLTGSGPAFCAGGDVKRMADRTTSGIGLIERRQRLRVVGRLAQQIRDLPVPVIAAVNGSAVGLGFSLVLAADLCLAGRSAWFSASFARVGLVPDGGLSFLLPVAVGRQQARHLLYTARRVDADEAVRLGIALEVVEDDDLATRARALAEELSQFPRETIALIKALANAADLEGLNPALEREAITQAVANGSQVHADLAAAFAARSKPPSSEQEEPS